MRSKSSEGDSANAIPGAQAQENAAGAQAAALPDVASLPPERQTRIAALPDSVRSRVLNLYRPVWIGHGEAVEIRDYVERLMQMPYSGRITSCAIVCPSYNGKTFLLRNIARRHNLKPRAADQERPISQRQPPSLPVFFMQSPPEPDESRLLDAMLRELRILGPQREGAESKIDRIQAVFRGLGVKLVELDEFGFFQAGSPDKQKKALNGLKYLSNILEVPIVLSTVEAGLNVLTSNEEIRNRYPAKFLRRWKADREDTGRMLVSLEKTLGLKEDSDLGSQRLAPQIVSNADEILGHIHDLLRLLAEQAIVSGRERITEADLKPDALKALGWMHPTMRHVRPA